MADPSFLDISSRFSIPGVKAGFSTRHFPYDSPDDRRQLALRLGLESQHLVVPKQIHSDRVVICKSAGPIPGADGIVSDQDHLVLSIQVADCLPVYMADPENGILGLIHIGWRGALSGIVAGAINAFVQLGGRSTSLKVLIGPSIRVCCFEVGPDIINRFDPSLIQKGRNGHGWVDLHSMVRDQLAKQGVPSDQIMDMEQCTSCQDDQFHSYRRDGSKSGRMIAVLGRRVSSAFG